jgi:uncharacterized delta-60 repeat protein
VAPASWAVPVRDAPPHDRSDARRLKAPALLVGAVFLASFLLPNAHGQTSSQYFSSPAIGNGQNIGSFSAIQPDGRILVNNGTVRLNTDGTIDATYNLAVPVGSNTQVAVTRSGNIIVQSGGALTECNPDGSVGVVLLPASLELENLNFTLQADGKIVVWADGTVEGAPYIARINSDGSVDTSFNPGYGPNAPITSVAVQSDGKLLVGGYFATFDHFNTPNFVRLNSDGTVDTTFDETGFPSITPTAIIELTNNQILMCDGGGRGVWLFNSDGTGATQVGSISGGAEDFTAIALQPDGKVLLGGAFTQYGTNIASGLIRLNSDGSFDSTFSAGSVLDNLGVQGVSTLAVDSAGHIYFCGSNSSENYYFAGAQITSGFVRLQSSGSPDLTFAPGGTIPGQVLASARSADGRVFVAGTFLSVNGVVRVGLAAFSSDGTLDTQFAPTIGIPWAPLPRADPQQPAANLTILADGSVLLAGTFSPLESVGSGGVVHFMANGALDTSFNPTFNSGGHVDAVAVLPNGEWVVGGNFTTVAGASRANLAGFSTGGTLDAAFGVMSGTNGPVTLLSVRPSGGLYLAGAFSEVGSERNDSLAALNGDGTVDTTFSASSLAAGTQITSMAPMGDGRLMVATLSSGAPLVRLLATGAPELVFALPSFGVANFEETQVTALTVDANGRALVGLVDVDQANPNGVRGIPPPAIYTYALARFTLSGDLDAEFVANGQQSNAAISNLSIGSDGLLVAGGSFASNPPSNGISPAPVPLTVFDGSPVTGLILMPQAAESVTVAPIVSMQPQAAAVGSGTTANFSVGAAGVGLSYQWNLNGVPIPFATNTMLTLSDVGGSNIGEYTVTVSNSAGTVTSNPVALSLTGPPLLLVQPSNVSVNVGGNAALTVSATGSAPLSYQWSLNGSAIADATEATLTLSNLSATQGGSVTVTVSNPQGSVTSSSASVTVLPNIGTARLADLSARAYVASNLGGGNILIAGFVTSGPSSKDVLVRGIGPALSSFGVTGVLANPQLTVFSGQTSLATTTSWNSSLSSTFSGVGAFALPAGSNDTALLETLGPGAYTATITSTNSQNGVALAEVYDADYTTPSDGNPSDRLTNLSARAYVGLGANVLIGGFVISGTSSETVLIRAVGPGLSSLGVTGALPSPVLTVYDSASPANVVATNAGWQNAPVAGTSPVLASLQPATAAAMKNVGAFSLAAGSADSAMVVTLPAGAYTAEITGANSSTGIALVEIYEIQ